MSDREHSYSNDWVEYTPNYKSIFPHHQSTTQPHLNLNLNLNHQPLHQHQQPMQQQTTHQHHHPLQQQQPLQQPQPPPPAPPLQQQQPQQHQQSQINGTGQPVWAYYPTRPANLQQGIPPTTTHSQPSHLYRIQMPQVVPVAPQTQQTQPVATNPHLAQMLQMPPQHQISQLTQATRTPQQVTQISQHVHQVPQNQQIQPVQPMTQHGVYQQRFTCCMPRYTTPSPVFHPSPPLTPQNRQLNVAKPSYCEAGTQVDLVTTANKACQFDGEVKEMVSRALSATVETCDQETQTETIKSCPVRMKITAKRKIEEPYIDVIE